MKHILIAVNCLTSVNALAYSSHCSFWHDCASDFPDFKFHLFAPGRMSIDRMRNESARILLVNDWDYLMFLDDDVLVPQHCFKMLYEAIGSGSTGVVAGNTLVRTYPYPPMYFKYTSKTEKEAHLEHYYDYAKISNRVDKDQPITEVDAVGFSCALIRGDLLREMKAPYFLTGTQNTEDVYFCVKIHNESPGTKLLGHYGVITSHLVSQIVEVNSQNVNMMRAFDEIFLGCVPEKDRGDRGEEYHDAVLKLEFKKVSA